MTVFKARATFFVDSLLVGSVYVVDQIFEIPLPSRIFFIKLFVPRDNGS